jgi:hypothetical protein
MKPFAYILIFLFSLSANNTWAQKPRIKFVQQQRLLPNDKGEKELQVQIEQYFNEFGDMTRQEYFYKDLNGQLKSDRKTLLSYDSKGRHQNTLDYNGQNILEKETKIFWDEKNNKNKVEEISYVEGRQATVAVTYLLEYDENGNKKEEKYFDDKGNIIRRRVWQYNSENEVVKAVTWVEEYNKPRTEETVTYQRDKDGNLNKSTSIEKVNGKEFRKDVRIFSNNYVTHWKKYIEGKLESEFINEYRDSVIIRQIQNKRVVIDPAKEKNQPKSAKKKDNKEDIWVTNTEYDVYGNVLVSTQSMNDKVIMITQYAYDDYGNKTKTLKINKETNEKEEERLDYEDFGNISKRTLLKNDKLLSEELFTYEYHPR